MSNVLPTRKEAIDMLRKSGCHDNVIAHCLAVEPLAMKIAKLANADLGLVCCSAILHDIGRVKTHGIGHAVEGARMVRELGLPETVALIIERHIGAGISKEEALKLGLPEKDYIPTTLEEKIVAHSDNLIEENDKKPIAIVVQRFERLGHKEAARKIFALHKELSEICVTDLDRI